MRSRSPARLWLGVCATVVVVGSLGLARADHDRPPVRPAFRLVVHGGAGTIRRDRMTPVREQAYRSKLTEAITAGHEILRGGGPALDAVNAVIRVLEDSPLFNAGKGAVFTRIGTNELDASIMDGATLNAGAVAGVKHVKNPIDLARLIMERSEHVMMAGDGAEEFALLHGIELVPREYFFTPRRWESWQRQRRPESTTPGSQDGASRDLEPEDGIGTVGAVALDAQGNLAAGTSTGGTTDKRFGRIGDSPVIGAGTYANRVCAVSATGHGEYFIRNVVAYDICARVAYAGQSLEAAARTVILETLVAQGADGGVIAVDSAGNIALPFNTDGMYRGHVGPDGVIVVKLYKD